jgi:ABC-type sugar transport system substrate-binding protein
MTPTQSVKADPIRIGLFLIDTKSLFQGQQKAAALSAAQKLGVVLDVAFAEGDCAKQRQQVFACVRQTPPPAAVIVEPVEDAGMRFVAQEALRKRIVWVLINRHVPWLAEIARELRGVSACVTADQEGIGRLESEQMHALLPRGGTVLYTTGPINSTCAQLRSTGMESLRGTLISIIGLAGAWTEQSGREAARAWIETTQGRVPFDVIAAQNDDMAVGGRKAAAEMADRLGTPALKDVPAIGVDGMTEYGIRLVDEGTLAATVIMPPTTGLAVEQVSAWLRAGTPLPPVTVVPSTSYPPVSALRPRH